jgi:dGTPase
MLNWEKLLSERRFGEVSETPNTLSAFTRSQFQRDYDRIIFSSPFRRLQNKTQVFPLPGSIFVHNRLTHSLEVASVGRSLGTIIARGLCGRKLIENERILSEIGGIVSAACLAHDLGNPPFGHSGENAISEYFKLSAPALLKSQLTDEQYADFCHFEGNANGLRLLTHQFTGRRAGGFALTYATLATIMKYPCDISALLSSNSPYQKYGIFQSEIDTASDIMEVLGLHQVSESHKIFARHPLVFLMEAADDICYQVVDIEDAHKLGIISTADSKDLLLNFFDPVADKSARQSLIAAISRVTDEHEQMNILRSRAINKLIEACSICFWEHYGAIMDGSLHGSLASLLQGTERRAIDEARHAAESKIYVSKAVVEIQVAGHQILNELLDVFTRATLNPARLQSKQLLRLLPSQLLPASNEPYHKIQAVIDFISGMTDVYALELYRKIKGISFNIVR